jgi:hypothetical protein
LEYLYANNAALMSGLSRAKIRDATIHAQSFRAFAKAKGHDRARVSTQARRGWLY